jgi:hypothetical protein
MMERTKFKSKGKEPPKILLPELSERILRLLPDGEYQLWNFYRKCAIRQNTDQIYCKNSFVTNIKGLGWTDYKVTKNKRGLYRKGLIKDILGWKKGNEGFGRKGDFSKKRYIKIFSTMEEDRLKVSETQREANGRSRYVKHTKSNESNSKPTETQREVNLAGGAKLGLNALKRKHKQYPFETPSSKGVSQDRKNIDIEDEEEDDRPLTDEYGEVINNNKKLKRTKKPIKHLRKRSKEE